ncbi:hypothetical protein [Gandjariella thermophila]|uniref:Uncharacterized protein n=1 Tax=Gandjariella thermophila TaxID=1931992 RepID=A0A4D4JJ72_9PSEU|nr:hypothetical protein [Gandjariella thermophila]GDY33953.1 hypothetical protein GTS_55860 [Gandjariella thermophila]
MTAPILLVRYRVGVVGESRRVVHVVPLADADAIPEVLATYCGERIPLGTVDLLDRPRGMPCTSCLAIAPLPAVDDLPKRDGSTALPPRRGEHTPPDQHVMQRVLDALRRSLTHDAAISGSIVGAHR